MHTTLILCVFVRVVPMLVRPPDHCVTPVSVYVTGDDVTRESHTRRVGEVARGVPRLSARQRGDEGDVVSLMAT